MPVARPSGRLTRRVAGGTAAAVCAVLLVSHVNGSATVSPDAGAPAVATTASGMLEASDAASRDPESPDVTSDIVLAAAARPLLARAATAAASATAATATAVAASAARSSSATTAALASTGAATVAASSRPLWARMPVLSLGATGTAVTLVQKKLRIKATGYYGPATTLMVRRFQSRHGIPVVGKVGPMTWKALLFPKAAPRKAAPKAAPTHAPRPAPAPTAPRSPVTNGRICPAPGASFGQGWGAQRAGHLHQGQDLMGSRGSAILAIEDAVVIREGRQSNGALRIVLQGRSGAKFYYGHMMRDLVHAGSRVKRGQVIGLMGDTGSPGAVHLHFEYWPSGRESAAVDPKTLLRSLC
jgi:murein DD-endopeptidase MepM/ murein hydrolase activator NlpD